MSGDALGQVAVDAEDYLGAEVGALLDSAGLGTVDLDARDVFGAELDAMPGRW